MISICLADLDHLAGMIDAPQLMSVMCNSPSNPSRSMNARIGEVLDDASRDFADLHAGQQ